MELAYDLRIIFFDDHRNVILYNGLDLFLHVGHQDRMISGKITSRFLNNCRMRNILIVANHLDDVNYVVCKFACIVICR